LLNIGSLNLSRAQCRHSISAVLLESLRRGENVYSVILTSSLDSNGDILKDFNLFVDKLVSELKCSIACLVVFELGTNGLEHLHCFLRCPFLPKDAVEKHWLIIHHAYAKQCKLFDYVDNGAYKVAKYLSCKKEFMGFLVSSDWYRTRGVWHEYSGL
jgi:hypothetical protein